MWVGRAVLMFSLLVFIGCKRDLKEAGERELAKNPMSVKAWQIKPSEKPIEMRFWASITSDYRGKGKELLYAFQLEDESGILYGFAARGTEKGERLFNLLADGRQHAMILLVERSANPNNSDECWIKGIVREGFKDDLILTR